MKKTTVTVNFGHLAEWWMRCNKPVKGWEGWGLINPVALAIQEAVNDPTLETADNGAKHVMDEERHKVADVPAVAQLLYEHVNYNRYAEAATMLPLTFTLTLISTKTTVMVTRDHVDRARKALEEDGAKMNRSLYCPVALAAQDTLKRADIHAWSTFLSIGVAEESPGYGDRAECAKAQKVLDFDQPMRDFIQAFDEENYGQARSFLPLEFEVEASVHA